MDAIMAARELGKAIQQDSRYIRMMSAQEKNDGDTELQQMIIQFNEMRNELNAEVQKDAKDPEKIKEMDVALKAMYKTIFDNENMAEFSSAREELQDMLSFINQIIAGSASGENPMTIEKEQGGGCAGDCGGCSGCN